MVSVYALGRTLIDAGGVHVTPTSVRKFALLLRLSAESGRRVARPVLQELVFPDQTDKNARHSLRELSYQLRQAGVAVQSDASGIGLAADGVRTDYAELLTNARPSAEQVEAAAGGFLPGYAPTHSEAYAEWFEGFSARSTFDVAKALVREITRARESADWIATERAARACLALDPMNEEGHLALAEVLAISGSKVQAVRLLERYIDEVGGSSKDLRLPAALLKRRITGNIPPAYSSKFASPFVGRSSETMQLASLLMQAECEIAQCVVLTGEPGVGKSRLLAEFGTIASLRGAVVAATVTRPVDLHRPFGSFGDLMPALLSLPGSLGCSPDALRLLDRLTKTASDAEFEGFQERGESAAISQSIAQAIIDLIDAIAGEQAIVLAIEDAHWLDRMSLRVLVAVASRRKPRRVLTVLTTRRLEGVEALSREGQSLTAIEVGPLDSSAASRMISALSEASGIEVDHEMEQWLVETSAGNPLFLETLFAHFVTTRQRFAVSPTLSALVARRLESLSTDAGTTLRICALLGKYSTLEAITEALQVPRLTLLRAVAELEAARLVTVHGRCIQPSHRLIAAVAQHDWAPATKHVAHHCVASALESLLIAEQSTALMWDCAEHWIAARNADKALKAIRRCSSTALEIGRPAEAAELLSRALDLEIGAADQIAICRQMVLAADEAAEPALVFRGLDVLRKHDRSQHHDELEFAEFRARSRAWNDASGEEEERLLQCVAAEDAAPNHRVTAATWLLKHSETQYKPALGRAATDALSADVLAAADESVRLEFLLITHCARLEWDLVVVTARQVLMAANAMSPQTSLRLRFNASLALSMCGRNSEAVEAATVVHFDAEAGGARHLLIRTAAFLADEALDAEDYPAAAAWDDRLAKLLDDAPNAHADFGPFVVQLIHLLTAGDAAGARALFDRVDRAGLFGGGRLRERWYKVLVERLRQVEKRTPSANALTVPPGDDWAKATQMLGLIDFEIATNCHAFLEIGKLEHASSLMTDYIAWRSSVRRQQQSRCLRVAQAEITAAIQAKTDSCQVD